MIYEVHQDGYSISEDPSLLDISFIYNFLTNESYWTKNIPLDIVKNVYKKFSVLRYL